jgi:fermentation-respiration switch protein FrsA (DUF1100 family)
VELPKPDHKMNETRDLVDGVYSENQVAMNAMNFATGSNNFAQIADLYGYRDDDEENSKK